MLGKDPQPKIGDKGKQEVRLSPRAKEVMNLFQQARKSGDLATQTRMLEDFRTKLVDLLTPSGKENENRNARSQRLPAILRGEPVKYFGDDLLIVGSGTSGERIYFTSKLHVWSDPEIGEKFGKAVDLIKKEENGKLTELASTDGTARWMFFPGPRQYGEEYRTAFIENFGDDMVDLLEKVEEND